MLYNKLEKDIIMSMKSGEVEIRDALRFLKSNVQQISKDTQKDIDDNMVISVAKKLVKQNNESLKLCNNPEQLRSEIKQWSVYIPKMLDETQTKIEIEKAIEDLEIDSLRQMGQLIKHLKNEFGQTLDMGMASKIIKSILKGN